MFETQIARGVALLDEKRPGWLDKIDLDRLNLHQVFYSDVRCGCICAQTNFFFFDTPMGSYYSELVFLGVEEEPVEYGFTVGENREEQWAVLTLEWKQAIQRLRAERSSVPAHEHELVTAGD